MKMLIFLTLLLSPIFAQADSFFSYEGILTDAGGTPINTAQSVTFQVLYGGACVTYEETQTVTPGVNGEFSVIIGTGTRTDTTGNTAAKIFGVSGTLNCQGGGTQALTGFAVRQLHVKVGSTDLLPDVVIGNVPFSWNAQKLADKSATDFIQVDGANKITQLNMESVFSRYDTLDDILNGDFTGTPVTGITGLTNASLAVGAAIDRTKIANGTINHVVINSGTGVLSSEAQLAISRGGTGLSTAPANGQLLIGNGTGYALSNITAGTGITVTNAAGSITIASNAGVGSVTNIATGAGLTGGPITSAGTISLGTELSALNALATTGIVHRTGAGTYATVGVPAGACAAGEALTWQSPVNAFACYSLTVDTAHVSGLDAAIDARIAADTTKLPLAGGTMTGNINLGNNQLSNVGYVHLQNKAADPGGLVAGNEGFVWYNSTDKMVKYYNGTAINSLPGYAGACSDGQILKWNNATKVWACAADAGAGGGANATQLQGANIAATAPTTGQFLKYNGTDWTPTSMTVCTPDQVLSFTALGVVSCNAISGLTNSAIAGAAAIDRTKLANGTASHVLINDGTGVMSSEAQLAVSRGGTGQSTYTNGELLIGNSTGNTLSKATLTQGTGITITNGNGTITIASSGSAPTGAAGGDLAGTYPNPTLKATGAPGTYTKVTTDAEGRVAVGAILAATDIPDLDASKITTGQFTDSQLVNIRVNKVISAPGQYFTYAPNNMDCAMGEVLKKTFNGWECGIDVGAGGGVDAVSLQGYAVSALAPATNKFMQWDGAAWTPWLFPTCGANSTLQVDVMGNISCTVISNISNANIDPAAAISRTKMASGTAGEVLINDGSGVMSSEAQLAVSRGGTGQSTFTNGELLIGNSTGNTLSKATLTQGSGITITNGNGTITIAATGGGGTVTNVSSSTSDISVATGTTTASLTLNSGTAGGAPDANKIAKLSGTGVLAVAMVPNLSAGIITSGTLPAIRGGTGSGTALTNNKVMVSSGGAIVEATAITASRALMSDANGIPTHSSVTGTELGYVSGVTSSIQTQIDGLTTGAASKVSKAGDTMTGDLTLNAQREVRFADSDSSNYVGLRSPATVGANKIWTLPAADGSNDQILKTDGAGNLGWTTQAAAPGDATYAAKGLIQFDSSEAFSGMTVTAGVASVKRTTVADASTILQLDAASKATVKGLYLKGTTNSVLISPLAGTNAYTLTLPSSYPALNGQVLSATTAGVMSWITPLTSVDSTAITDGSIMNADVNGAAAIARNKLANGNNSEVLINDGTGVMTSEAQLAVARGGTGSPSFTANSLVMAGATNTSPLIAFTCASIGRTLEWNGSAWVCSNDFLTTGVASGKVNYVLLAGGISASGVTVSAAGSNASIDLNLLAKGSGSVRVGSKFEVDYETVSKTFRTIASGSTAGLSINFANGNLQYTTSDCGAMTLSGMQDGATYVLAVKGTNSSTCSFTAGGLAIKLPPDHGPTEAGKSTLYTFMVMGTDVYVSWVTGY